MKFKKGDRVVLLDSRWNHMYTTGIVWKDTNHPYLNRKNGKKYIAVRFDGFDYGDSISNCHSGWTVDDFDLDMTYYSPLGQALRD